MQESLQMQWKLQRHMTEQQATCMGPQQSRILSWTKYLMRQRYVVLYGNDDTAGMTPSVAQQFVIM
jgi:hypothetical protein